MKTILDSKLLEKLIVILLALNVLNYECFSVDSFLFCFRYSGHNSVLYIELCPEYLKHTSFYRYHVGLGGNCFILSFLCLYFVNRDSSSVRFFYTSIHHVRDGGGGIFLIVFSFCIPMLHATHGRSVVKLLHSDWHMKYFRD